MTNDTLKAREFWIEPGPMFSYSVAHSIPTSIDNLHVIEYSAYEALKDTTEIHDIYKDEIKATVLENEALRKERDEYRAALEHFASVHEKAVPYQDLITGAGSIDKLRSILAKYPKEKP